VHIPQGFTKSDPLRNDGQLDADRRAACGRTQHVDRSPMRLDEPRAVARPRPVPRDFVVKNGVKIFSRMSGGMPGPSSAKSMRHLPADTNTDTWMRPLPSRMA